MVQILETTNYEVHRLGNDSSYDITYAIRDKNNRAVRHLTRLEGINLSTGLAINRKKYEAKGDTTSFLDKVDWLCYRIMQEERN